MWHLWISEATADRAKELKLSGSTSWASKPMGLLFSFSLTQEPIGVKISKCYLSFHNYNSLSSKLFLNIPCGSPRKGYFCAFEILTLKVIKKLEFSLTWDPMGVNISKRHSYSYDSFSTKLFRNVLCDGCDKSYLLEFWNSNFNLQSTWRHGNCRQLKKAWSIRSKALDFHLNTGDNVIFYLYLIL